MKERRKLHSVLWIDTSNTRAIDMNSPQNSRAFRLHSLVSEPEKLELSVYCGSQAVWDQKIEFGSVRGQQPRMGLPVSSIA